MIIAKLEDGTVIEAVSFGDMLEKAYKRGQRVRDYNYVGRKAQKVKKWNVQFFRNLSAQAAGPQQKPNVKTEQNLKVDQKIITTHQLRQLNILIAYSVKDRWNHAT